MTNSWAVYIIETENGRFYTGITTDPQRRFNEHLSGKGGARFFRTSRAKRICYQETHPDRSSASRREAEIKKLSHRAKLTLIGNVVSQ